MSIIDSPEALGRLIREQRRTQGLRQDDLAQSLGTSHIFLRKLERGEVSQVRRLLALLVDLGIRLEAHPPQSADAPKSSI